MRLLSAFLNGLWAHITGSLLLLVTHFSLIFLTIFLELPLSINGQIIEAVTTDFIGDFILIFITVPFAVAGYFFLKLLRYTDVIDYILAGTIIGLLAAICFPIVDIHPESNGYEEIFGWRRALEFLLHYLHGSIVGFCYALAYWWVLVAPSKTNRKNILHAVS